MRGPISVPTGGLSGPKWDWPKLVAVMGVNALMLGVALGGTFKDIEQLKRDVSDLKRDLASNEAFHREIFGKQAASEEMHRSILESLRGLTDDYKVLRERATK